MATVLLIIHLFVTLALIGVVLIQRSEGGGLGIGSSQGMGAFMGGRGTANLLTRTTAILGTLFFALSLALALLNRGTSGVGRSILDTPPPVTAPAANPVVPGAPTSSTPGTSPSGTSPSGTSPSGTSPSGAPSSGTPSPAGSAVPAPGAAPARGPAVPTN